MREENSKEAKLTHLEHLEEEFEVRRKSLSEQEIAVLTRIIKEAKSEARNYSPTYEYTVKKLNLKLALIEQILYLPKNLAKVADPDRAFQEMDSHLKTYDPSVKRMIQRMLNDIITRANQADKATEKPVRDTIAPIGRTYFFKGAPGTGKTETAKAVARALGLPFCKLSLSRIQLSDFIGSVEKPDTNSVDQVRSAIAKCFTNPDSGQPSRNPLILIDEVHYLLNSNSPEAPKFKAILQEALEPSQRTMKDEGLGIDIDISGATFILNSNEEIISVAGAFSSRVLPVEFPPILPENKVTIAKNTFQIVAESKGYKIKDSDYALLTDILREEKEPGARTLQLVIGQYVDHLVLVRDGKVRGASTAFNAAEEVARLAPKHEQRARSSDSAAVSSSRKSTLSADPHTDPEFLKGQLQHHQERAKHHEKMIQMYEGLLEPL